MPTRPFVSHPHRLVTNVAFEAFSCYEFEGGRSWLVADVAIECKTLDHDHAKDLARVAIAVYPVGIFVLNAALLFSARKAIYYEQPTMLYRTIDFLHREYQQVRNHLDPAARPAALTPLNSEHYLRPSCWCETGVLLVGTDGDAQEILARRTFRRLALPPRKHHAGRRGELDVDSLSCPSAPGDALPQTRGRFTGSNLYLAADHRRAERSMCESGSQDDHLALGCSLSLSVMFLCTIFYKYASLVQLPDKFETG